MHNISATLTANIIFSKLSKKLASFFACVQKLCEAFIEKLGNIIFSS